MTNFLSLEEQQATATAKAKATAKATATAEANAGVLRFAQNDKCFLQRLDR
jgi:hypothetical protein